VNFCLNLRLILALLIFFPTVTCNIQVYEDKLKQLKAATRDVFSRVKELNERPAAVEAFNNLVNHTEYFLKAMKNFTGEDQPFTQVEFDVLEKLLTESKV
jgi:hypothetical protein